MLHMASLRNSESVGSRAAERRAAAVGPSAAVAADPVLAAGYDVLLDVGPGKATMAEVARRAGISRMTLYRRHDQMRTLISEVLTAELTAINQYFVHAKMCGNWGFERLATHTRAESIDEMTKLLAKELRVAKGDITAAVSAVVKVVWAENEQIAFGGDGYSDAWQEEAEQRGLTNLRTTPDALPAIIIRDLRSGEEHAIAFDEACASELAGGILIDEDDTDEA